MKDTIIEITRFMKSLKIQDYNINSSKKNHFFPIQNKTFLSVASHL